MAGSAGEAIAIGGFDDAAGGGHGGQALVEGGGADAADWRADSAKGCGWPASARAAVIRSSTDMRSNSGLRRGLALDEFEGESPGPRSTSSSVAGVEGRRDVRR